MQTIIQGGRLQKNFNKGFPKCHAPVILLKDSTTSCRIQTVKTFNSQKIYGEIKKIESRYIKVAYYVACTMTTGGLEPLRSLGLGV